MAVDKHLAYEVDQMCNCLDLLQEVWPAMHGTTPARMAEGTAYFEAALLHMRNLIEFLVRGHSASDDSIGPSDVGLPFYDYGPARSRFAEDMDEDVETTYGRICTYVSHLSRARTFGAPTWALQPLRDVLLDEMRRLAKAAEAAGYELPQVSAALARRL